MRLPHNAKLLAGGMLLPVKELWVTIDAEFSQTFEAMVDMPCERRARAERAASHALLFALRDSSPASTHFLVRTHTSLSALVSAVVRPCARADDFEKDLLEEIASKINEGMEQQYPITALVMINLKVKPKLAMPLKVRAQMRGKAKLAIIAKNTSISVNIAASPVDDASVAAQSGPHHRATPPDLTDSYITVNAAVTASAALQLQTGLSVGVQLCFVAVCGGITIAYSHEMAAGADFGLGAATELGRVEPDDSATVGAFSMGTWFTEYVEYPMVDLTPYTQAVERAEQSTRRPSWWPSWYRAAPSGGVVVGMGLWYYVTLPALTITLDVGFDVPALSGMCMGTAGPKLEHTLLDSVQSGLFKSMALPDANWNKMNADERAADAENRNPLTSAQTPYLARDTHVFAAKVTLPTAGSTLYFLKNNPLAELLP